MRRQSWRNELSNLSQQHHALSFGSNNSWNFTTMRIISHLLSSFLCALYAAAAVYVCMCFNTHFFLASFYDEWVSWRMEGMECGEGEEKMVCERFWCHLSFCFMPSSSSSYKSLNVFFFYIFQKWFIKSRRFQKKVEIFSSSLFFRIMATQNE